MKSKKIFLILVGIVLLIVLVNTASKQTKELAVGEELKQNNQVLTNPLAIEAMRKKTYPGSELKIEETLADGSNYKRYLASYLSDGLKIYGLLTIPRGNTPVAGWPVIIFNHGYIPPEEYKTTERYVAYVDGFSRNGYVVFKPDYRGHGNSEGRPEGAYYSPAYATDVLNALASVKKLQIVDPNKIGMWGHSLGGNLTLRAMVVSKEIKAGVIWSGVVGTYEELINKWSHKTPWQPSAKEANHVGSIRQNLVNQYGTPESNPGFWHSIDPRYYLTDISGPILLNQGLNDEEVPPLFAESLKNDLEKLGKTFDYYTYPGGDHNLSSPNFEKAMQRSIKFFDKYLK